MPFRLPWPRRERGPVLRGRLTFGAYYDALAAVGAEGGGAFDAASADLQTCRALLGVLCPGVPPMEPYEVRSAARSAWAQFTVAVTTAAEYSGARSEVMEEALGAFLPERGRTTPDRIAAMPTADYVALRSMPLKAAFHHLAVRAVEAHSEALKQQETAHG